MKLITTQDMADTSAARWYEKYSNYCGSGWFNDGKERIYGQLVALVPDVTPDQVAKVVGHNCWTWLLCGTCGEDVEAAIEYDGTHSHEYGTCLMCVSCVRAMAKLVGP